MYAGGTICKKLFGINYFVSFLNQYYYNLPIANSLSVLSLSHFLVPIPLFDTLFFIFILVLFRVSSSIFSILKYFSSYNTFIVFIFPYLSFFF